MDRRQFLALTPTLLLSPACAPAFAPENTKPATVALIGTGWYGKMDLFRLLQIAEVEVVALCDVDEQQLSRADAWLRQRHADQKPRLYADHQELLRKEKPEVVLIETPDHWHALIAKDCLAAGCHLYLQKPVGVDVRECEAVLDAARKHDRVVQVALQRRSTPHLLEAKRRFLDSGLLGDVHHVEMWCYYGMRDTAVREQTTIPDYFDYDRWTGPAPLLPFKGIPHRRWRSFQAYGNGIVGDMCVHYLDAVRWLLGLGWPSRVSSHGGIRVQTAADATTTDTQTAVFEYPDHGLNCHWTHRSWGGAPDPEWPWAFVFYGEKGTFKADTLKCEFTPHDGEPVRINARIETDKYPEDKTEDGIELHVASATRGHLLNFLEAIKSGQRPAADIEEGYISSAACILANIAKDLGRPLAYDPATREVINDEEANTLLARSYRSGWKRP